MIKITDKAKIKMREFAEEQGIEKLILRIKVLGGGCAGFQYDLFFEEVVSELDDVSEHDDIKIVIDPLSLQYLDNSEIDIVETSISTTFKINNPNVTATCGCGSSFSY